MGTLFISQTRWVSTTTTTKVSTTRYQLRALKLLLLLLLLLDLADSLLTDRDSTTISRENPSKVSTTTDLTARPLSPPRGKKTRMRSEHSMLLKRKRQKRSPFSSEKQAVSQSGAIQNSRQHRRR